MESFVGNATAPHFLPISPASSYTVTILAFPILWELLWCTSLLQSFTAFMPDRVRLWRSL